MHNLQKSTDFLAAKLNEIRLSLTHPQNKDKVFVLLEGKSDIKLFRSIFSSDLVDITSLSGKNKIIDALKNINDGGFSQIIGIQDADFDHLENVDYPENLFITDYHDMEIQMVETTALMKIVNEYSPDECLSTLETNIKNYIYDIAIDIGYARWFNNIKNSNLNFKRLPLRNFTNVENCNIKFDYDKFLCKLLTHPDSIISDAELKTELEKLKDRSNDKLQICNGHDLTELIAIIFHPKDNINQQKIETALRLAYSIDDFKSTQLFKNLNAWCAANRCQMFDAVLI